MTVPEDTTKAQEAAIAAGSAAGILERLADKLGGAASVSAVFGEPVEHHGTTVIPVARVSFGMGAGAGVRRKDAELEGGGGGGGGSAEPAGFIEITDAGAVFRPIHEPLAARLVPLAGIIAGSLAPRAIRALRRRRSGD
jgi:uncharacterized spore protein YtfJ